MRNPVLFDLDGTVADTAPDLALALNLLRQEYDLPALELSEIRPLVSLGAMSMLRYAFGPDRQFTGIDHLRERFLTIYRDNICRHTRLFPGIDAVLDYLDHDNICWGIVTNKPGWLTLPLLDSIGLTRRAACIVSGDTLPERKPSPAPLLYACRLIPCPASGAIYIGDTASDIQAGINAGMLTAVAGYGYLETGADPHSWGADFIFDQPVDILRWLQGQTGVD